MNDSIKCQASIAILGACFAVSVAQAQSPAAPQSAGANSALKGAKKAVDGGIAPLWKDGPEKHPLMPALRWAKDTLPRIEQIDCYTAKMIKRERAGGKLRPTEFLSIKVRQKPFSIYVKYLAPRSMKGEEAIYVAGANKGKMWAHCVGIRGLAGTVSIEPTDPLAMEGERYPLTEVGILQLTKRLVEVAESDMKFGECSMKWIDHVKINGRPCHYIEVDHPQPRKNFLFHIARVFVDDELNLPVRYECYGWPSEPGDNPPLMEECTYLDVTLNAGLTEADFDVHNPVYHFRPANSEMAKGRSAGTR